MAPVTFNAVSAEKKSVPVGVDFSRFVPQDQNGGFIRVLDGIPQMVGKLGGLDVSIIQDGGRVKASLSNTTVGYRGLDAVELATLGRAVDAWLAANKGKYAAEPPVYPDGTVHYGGTSGVPLGLDGQPFVDTTGYVSKGDYDDVAAFRETIRSFEKNPVQSVVVETGEEKKQRLGFDFNSHFTY